MARKARGVKEFATLKALANPARIRLYEVLVQAGPATVSDLANKTGLAVGSASYHLGQMHAAGLIAQAKTPSHDGRERWWEALPGALRWSAADFTGSPGRREASTAGQRLLAQRRSERLAHWHRTWHRWGREWLDATSETDAVLMLTSSEMATMGAELQAVIRKWSAGTGRPSPRRAGDRSRKPVFAFLYAFPMDDDAPRR
ncbi:MAG TPA: helix-turn-helix domain-containing protein [Actinomycetota bacterium]